MEFRYYRNPETGLPHIYDHRQKLSDDGEGSAEDERTTVPQRLG